jgi:hypothetical protein
VTHIVGREAGVWFLDDPVPFDDLYAPDIVDHYVALARDMAAAPRYHLPAHGHEGRLSKPVHWRGRQWAVTAYGIEGLEYPYLIDRHRIWEDEDVHGWVKHMAEKNWVDLADFTEALRIARMQWRCVTMRPKPSSHRKKLRGIGLG